MIGLHYYYDTVIKYCQFLHHILVLLLLYSFLPPPTLYSYIYSIIYFVTALVNQLMSMGFSENGCRRAAIATQNADPETAANWMFAHMDDTDFNDPLPQDITSPLGTLLSILSLNIKT